MNDPLTLIFAALAGCLLGVIFFGGLWWTIRKGVSSPRPVLWFLGSFVVRVGVVLLGFYSVGNGRWERFLACLVGFLAARIALVRLTRNTPPTPTHPAEEGSHAPQP
jgi:F1F0 ATPase subunit 2